MCESILFSLLGRHGAGDPPQTVEGVETDHVSDQSSRQRRRKIIWKLRRYCPAMTWKSTVSAAVSPTSNQILMLNTRVFYATWLRTTSIGSGESHGVLWPGIMLRQLDRWDEAWYHVKDHLNYSTFKHLFFSQKLPNKSQNCIPTNLFFLKLSILIIG